MVDLLDLSKAQLRLIIGFPLVDADIAVGANVDAAKIGTGVVDNTEFDRLNGITSALEEQGNKGAVSGYAGLDASQELLLANFPSGNGLEVLRRNVGNTALEFAVAGVGDMVLAAVQTVTGAKTFEDGTLLMRNVADSFNGSFVNTNTADRIYTLPDVAGTVVITGLASQIVIGTEVTGASTALTDTADIAYLNTPNIYTDGSRQDFLGLLAGTAGINVGGIAGNPTTQVDGDLWLNTSSNVLFARINGADIGLSEVFTWTADHSMATFKLTATAANDVIVNAPSGQAFSIEVAAAQQFSFDVNQANFLGNNLINMGTLSFDDANTSITQATLNLQIDVAINGAIVLRVNNTPEFDFDAARADFNSNNLINLGRTLMVNRFQWDKGANIASPVGGILTLGDDGNFFDITGTNTINEIVPTNWQAGSEILLHFDGILTVTNNSGGTNDILLGDGSNFVTAVGNNLRLVFNGVDWEEVSRNIPGGGGGEVFIWTANHDANGFALEDARFADDTDNTKIIDLNLVGMTTGITAILDFNFTTAKTITFPDAAGTVVITGLASQITLGTEVTGALANLSDVTAKTGTGTIVVMDTSPTIVTPVIASFTTANHDHTAGAGGGLLTNTALTSGVFAAITGVGAQSQAFDLNSQNIINGGTAAFTIITGVDLTLTGLQELDQGPDKTSGAILTVPAGGNYFDVTASTTINEMAAIGIQAGTIIVLKFDGAPLITNVSGGTNDFILAGGVNFQTAAGDILTVVFDGVDWREVSRNSVGGGGEVFTWTADHSAAGFNLTNAGVIASAMIQEDTGANIVGAATITIPLDEGNVFHLTGTTNLEFINNTGIQDGTKITLIIDDAGLLILDNQGGATGDEEVVLLRSSVDYNVGIAGIVFDFVLTDAGWVEMGRSDYATVGVAGLTGSGSSNLVNFDSIQFGTGASSGAGTREIYGVGGGMDFNVATGGTFTLRANNIAEYLFSTTALDMNNNNLTDVGRININTNTASTFGGRITYTNTNLASATNMICTVTASNTFDVTGTTQIVTIDGSGGSNAWVNGAIIILQFDEILVLEHLGSKTGNQFALNLTGGANYTTAAGDVFMFRANFGALEWQEVSRSSPVVSATTVLTDQINVYDAGLKQTFIHDATNAGIRINEFTGDPSSLVDGDLWLNQTSNTLFARINGVSVNLGAGAAGGEANTISSLGGGTVLTAAVSKSGVNLQTVSIATTAPLAHSVTTDLLTFTLNALVNADISASAAITTSKLADSANFVLINQVNNYGDFAQTFLDDILKIERPTGGGIDYTIVAGEIAANRNAILPILTADSTFAFADFANAWGIQNQNIAATGKWQEGGVAISPVGTHEIGFDAGSALPTTTGGASAFASEELGTAGNVKEIGYIEFANAATNSVTLKLPLPNNYDNGTIQVRLYWYAPTTAAGNVRWEIKGVALGNSDLFSTAYGTPIAYTDTGVATAFDQVVGGLSGAITLGNSPATDDFIFINISRLGSDGADTLTDVCRLTGGKVQVGIDAAVAT